MSNIEPQSEVTYDPQRVAAEVLELGAALFDDVIDAAAAQRDTADVEPFPEDNVRAAAAEFFTALRLLLGLPE